jgi:hypothetical protein
MKPVKTAATTRQLTETELQVLRNASEKQIKILCACTNKPCAGECRDKNLRRERKEGNPCPSAFIPPTKKREYYGEDD